MLRVLLDGSPLQDGRRTAGIGRYVDGLSEALRNEDGLEVELVMPSPPPRDSWLIRYLSAQPTLVATAVRRRPALVHGMASDPVIGWPLHRQVVTVHDVIPWLKSAEEIGHKTAWYLEAQKRRLRRVSAVIAVSAGVAKDIEEVLGVHADRIHVVPNGVAAVFSPEVKATDRTERIRLGVTEMPYLLWVGSMRHHDPRKDLDTLIDAVAALDPPIGLVMAGATGDESRRLAALATERRIRIVLPGYVDDTQLACLIRGAAAVVVPSLHEGFGLPALEAMACGAALVTIRDTNTAQLAAGACILADPGNPRSLAGAIGALVGDSDRAAELRRRGLARAAEHSWARTAHLTHEVYRQASAKVSKRPRQSKTVR